MTPMESSLLVLCRYQYGIAYDTKKYATM